MNRREFIKAILVPAVGGFAGLSYFLCRKTNKEEIIAKALGTEEGEISFKKVFCKPLTNEEARTIVAGWQIACNPTIKLSELKGRRFYIKNKEKQNV